jgi:hypothetical protein
VSWAIYRRVQKGPHMALERLVNLPASRRLCFAPTTQLRALCPLPDKTRYITTRASRSAQIALSAMLTLPGIVWHPKMIPLIILDRLRVF